jgi:hypothetical protein
MNVSVVWYGVCRGVWGVVGGCVPGSVIPLHPKMIASTVTSMHLELPPPPTAKKPVGKMETCLHGEH